VRVSNELGKGNAKAAKFSIKVVLGVSICIGVIFFALCLAFGKQISYIFTSNEETAEEVSSLSTLLAFSILLNSVQPVLSGNNIIHLQLNKYLTRKKKYKRHVLIKDSRLGSCHQVWQ
jgi:peptidoglycan biosynthesis protein MviN/MurJ (putative lipid II flippase)